MHGDGVPTISGKMSLRRDQVLMTRFSLLWFSF